MKQNVDQISNLVDDRLKALGLWPVPPSVRAIAIQRVNDQLAGLVEDTLKDWATVVGILRKADPAKNASTPPAAIAEKVAK